MHQRCQEDMERQTKDLSATLKVVQERLKEEMDRTRSLTTQLEKKTKDVTDLSKKLKDQDELLDQLNDKRGLNEIKDILDNFGDSMDILSLEKQVQLNVMNKACGILKQRLEPKSLSKGKNVEIKLSKESEPVQQKSFADELKNAKRNTNFLFYKSALPFDISNISPQLWQQIQEYF